MAYRHVRLYQGALKAAILDWSGTTADKYVLAPAVVFYDVFNKHKVPITMEEARGPMGLRKDLHIKVSSPWALGKDLHIRVSGPWASGKINNSYSLIVIVRSLCDLGKTSPHQARCKNGTSKCWEDSFECTGLALAAPTDMGTLKLMCAQSIYH